MTAEELEKIVARYEMQCLGLKESFNVECIETACAFTNAQGGFIVIGVDSDGNPLKRQLRFEGLRDYENKISTATEPSVAVDAEKVEFRGREVVRRMRNLKRSRTSNRSIGTYCRRVCPNLEDVWSVAEKGRQEIWRMGGIDVNDPKQDAMLTKSELRELVA